MTFHQPPVTSVSFGTVGPLINREVMVDGAWRKYFGMKPPKKGRKSNAGKPPKPQPLTYNERLTISVIAGRTYTHDGAATTGDMVQVLMLFLNCRSPDPVIRILRNLEEAGFIIQVQNEDRGTIYHWRLRDTSVRRRLDALAPILLKIDEVLAAQVLDPENPEAGKELLPEPDGIYYNIVSRRDAYRAQSGQS